jgi:hypothetical protein
MSYAKLKPDCMAASLQQVHPDDRGRVAMFTPVPARTLHECLAEEAPYTIVRRTLAETPFRVLSESIVKVPDPKLRLGEAALSILDNPPTRVEVFRIEWHNKRMHEVYFVTRNGRVSGRQYVPEELSGTVQK